MPLGERIGVLHKKSSKELGLIEGIPVIEGGIDAHIGYIGLNAVKDGNLGAILGTSNVFFVSSNTPIYSDKYWGPYPDAIIDGKWLVEGGQTTSGSIIKWLLNIIIEGVGLENSYQK